MKGITLFHLISKGANVYWNITGWQDEFLKKVLLLIWDEIEEERPLMEIVHN